MSKWTNRAGKAYRLLTSPKKLQKKLGATYRDVRRVFYPHLSVRARRKASRFLKDTSTAELARFLSRLKSEHYDAAIVMGNGPSFTLLNDSHVAACRSANYLTIGLNRSVYRFLTHVLIWSDVETLESILGPESVIDNDDASNPMHVLQAVLPVGEQFQRQIQMWEANRTFEAFPKTKLFMFRTVLVAALHLCFILKIKKIVLVGVDMDNRTYFFRNDSFDPNQAYELRPEKAIRGHFRGYSTHRIVKEVLESLVKQHDFDIRYMGDSKFLGTVEGLKPTPSPTPF